MIDAKELRIGNYIDFIGGLQKGQDERVVNLDIAVIGDYPDSVNPIPLTEEWLFKFGFEKIEGEKKRCWSLDNSVHFWFFKNGRIDLRINGIDFKDHERTFKRYDFVHKLQNLYYVLKGKELTIKK